MSGSLRRRQEWQLFTALHRAAPALSTVWDLLARGGTYAELYAIQATAYR